MKENENPSIQKKTVLRAPPRSVELTSTLDTLKVYRKLGEQKHYYYVRIGLIITDIISLVFGIYILVKFDKYLSKEFNFSHRKLLLFFIYIFSKCYRDIYGIFNFFYMCLLLLFLL